MGSLNDRLGRLEAQNKPGWVPDPEMVIGTNAVCKSMDRARREAEGRPPDPANEFTEEELAFDRKATRAFLPYLEKQRELAQGNPAGLESIEQMIRMTQEDIARLDEEDDA